MTHYGLRDFRFRLLQRSSVKQLHCVSSAEGNFALQIYDPTPTSYEESLGENVVAKLRSEAAMHSQMLWLSALRREMRLPVPEPIPTSSGSLVGCIPAEGASGPRLFTLLRWIPGEHRKGNLTPSDVYSLGAYIAAMHLHAQRHFVPEGFVRPRWDWSHLFGDPASRWDLREAVFSKEQLEMISTITERIRRTMREIGEPCDAFGLIHRDLSPSNLVFHEGVFYAIDFDQCGWGYYMYDLARPYILLGLHYKDRYETMRAALLEGYQSVRHLPNGHLESLQTFVSMWWMVETHRVLVGLDGIPFEKVAAHPKWRVVQGKMRRLEESFHKR